MFERKILKQMEMWKNGKHPKPLVLRGARQVGKTSVVRLFADKFFDDFIEINLEKAEHSRLFSKDLSLDEFEQIVNIYFKKSIVPGKTLVFIDEIQNSPFLIKLLRFFYEERPGLHILAAGSLLESTIRREGLSLPVGRVEYLYLYPVDFFEFLHARGEDKLLNFFKKLSSKSEIPSSIHELAMKLFYEYAMIGGMPEVVVNFLKEKNIQALQPIYSSLLTAYGEDVYKYANYAQTKYLRYIIDQAPLFAGTSITYEKFSRGVYKSREMKAAFELLETVLLLEQIYATSSVDLPILAQPKRPKKLLFLDVGLVNYRCGIQSEYLQLADLNGFYRGRIAEQIVGQQLLAQSSYDRLSLFYWAKSKPEAAAEIDFCFVHKGRPVGLEVKSGNSMKLGSLMSFADAMTGACLIRVYAGELKLKEEIFNDKKYRILSIPFYLVPEVFRLIEEM